MNRGLFRQIFLLAGAAFLFVAASCESTVPPLLQHLKRPHAGAFVSLKREGKDTIYFYVTNEALDRLAVVNAVSRGFLIDPNVNTPGILYIPTGRGPVDVVASPDQKRLFVLNGMDGDISLIDPVSNTPEKNKEGEPWRIPAACEGGKGSCWRLPRRIVLRQTSDKKLIALIALAGERAVIALNVTRDDPNFGQEIGRYKLQGTPSDLILHPSGAPLYVTDSENTSLHIVDPEKMEGKTLDVEVPVLRGALTPDGNFLYLVDRFEGALRVVDTQKLQLVQPGNERFPEEKGLRPASGIFRGILFLKDVKINIRNIKTDDEGNEVCETTNTTGTYGFATTSAGYLYLINPKTHTLFDADSCSYASVSNLQLYVGDESIGDPRADPNSPPRERNREGTLPYLVAKKPVSDTEKLPQKDLTGIEVFPDKTRSEQWNITFEGHVIDTGRVGRLTNGKGTRFADLKNFDYSAALVQTGDRLILVDGCEAPTPTAATDGGNIEQAPTPQFVSCEMPITKVDGQWLEVGEANGTLRQISQFSYEIRSTKNYTVWGSITGLLAERLVENKKYTSRYFALLINSGSEPTPPMTSFRFQASSGFSPKNIALGGMPGPLYLSPEGEPRLWTIDPNSSRLYVVNPTEEVTREAILQ